MPKKHDRKDMERILRRRGSKQHADVRANVTEIRSCGVSGQPEPLPPDTDGLLGGLVIIWEYSVDAKLVKGFHDLLRNIEIPLSEGLPKIDPKNSGRYLGTYMLHAGGIARYRTIWAYSSLQAMTDIWKNAVKANSKIVQDASQLRAYWLADPARDEARYIPARMLFQEGKNLGDAFAWITLQVAQAGIPRNA